MWQMPDENGNRKWFVRIRLGDGWMLEGFVLASVPLAAREAAIEEFRRIAACDIDMGMIDVYDGTSPRPR